MKAAETNQLLAAQNTALQAPAEAERTASRAGHLIAKDRVTRSQGEQKHRLESKRARAGRDPLAGRESQPSSDGGYPISDSVFNGASAAYYAALFAYEAVKSMGTVQDAYNLQEVDSFDELAKVWDQFAHEDKKFIQKQANAYIYSGVASAVLGVGATAGVMGWGIGTPKGWFSSGQGMEGEINQYYNDKPKTKSFDVLDDSRNPSELNNPTSFHDDDESEDSESSVQLGQSRVELEAQSAQRNGSGVRDTEEELESLSKAEKEKQKGRIEWLQKQLQQHTNKFQMFAQLTNAASQAGGTIAQGVGQTKTAATKQNIDSYDKTKQLTQQVFQTEDQGWSSAVQTLKEMTGVAANEINQLAAAEQRA